MTHYLHTKNNKTIVDIEQTKDDIRCVVSIREYSYLLLNMENKREQNIMIEDFNNLQEIRGTWFEVERIKKDKKDIK